MPELPDLEILKDILNKRVIGREISSARALRPGILKTVEPALEALEGQAITKIRRRGKLLIFTLRPNLHLVSHLMVAGRFVLCRSYTRPTKATGLVITFSDGEDLRLIENGPVKLAKVHVVEDPFQVEMITTAGLEPLSPGFSVEALARMTEDRRRQVKKLLTDQKMIAGIGTAYADEILFAAKISPIRYVNTLSRDELSRLHAAIREVLQNAIEQISLKAGDSLFTDEIRDFMRVYKHAGEPCPICGNKIAEIRYAKKRTYYCPTCQTSGRVLPDRRSWIKR
jgi:formamidopyrimidine-DNA glycosylase